MVAWSGCALLHPEVGGSTHPPAAALRDALQAIHQPSIALRLGGAGIQALHLQQDLQTKQVCLLALGACTRWGLPSSAGTVVHTLRRGQPTAEVLNI